MTNPVSIHHSHDVLLNMANDYRIDNFKESYVGLVSNHTNVDAWHSGDLKSKDHMHHHPLDDCSIDTGVTIYMESSDGSVQ